MLEDFNERSLGLFHCLAAQKRHAQSVAAIQIAHGQGIHPRAIAGPKPAFKVHCPNVVALPRSLQTRTDDHRPGFDSATTRSQSPTFEPATDRGHRRTASAAVTRSQTTAYLSCAPRGALLAQPHHPLQPEWLGPSSQMSRTTRFIFQSLQSPRSKTVQPFISCDARNLKASAQRHHRRRSAPHLKD